MTVIRRDLGNVLTSLVDRTLLDQENAEEKKS